MKSAQPRSGLSALSIASLPRSQRKQALETLSEEDFENLLYAWEFWRRPEQTAPPGDWITWVALAGRGWGKSRSGAEFVRENVEDGNARRIALVSRTTADIRDVMVEGESGLLAVSAPYCRPKYQPSKRRVVWPNGAIATCYSGDKPDQLRGPQHDLAWVDELASFRYAEKTWDNLQMGLRLGERPRTCVTTTPRPIKLLRQLIADPTSIVTGGSTYENLANLSPQFKRVIAKYEGTTLGQQELWAKLLDDVQGALWKHALIDKSRVTKAPDLARIVVAIDPSVSSKSTSAECGIIVAGIGRDSHGYVLDDASKLASPAEWAKIATDAYREHKADRIVAEINNGGDLVETVIRTHDKKVAYWGVHASRGKRTRAEPVAALYEQGKVHHVGMFAELEDQMCTWEPLSGDESPDRMDALVWALSELMLGAGIHTTAAVPDLDMGDRGP